MSAAELRRAAKTLRDPIRRNTSGFEDALADWLEAVAERQKPTGRFLRRSHSWTGSREANAVARLINGGAS